MRDNIIRNVWAYIGQNSFCLKFVVIWLHKIGRLKCILIWLHQAHYFNSQRSCFPFREVQLLETGVEKNRYWRKLIFR